jgi:hypothetical protein
MWIVLIAAAAVVVGALATLVVRRPRGSDLHSVAKYHSALGTIEQMAERTAGPTGRVPAPPGDRPGGGESGSGGGGRGSVPAGTGHVGQARGSRRSVPPVPVRGNAEFPDPEEPIVFDDARPQEHLRGEANAVGAPPHRVDRAQRHALESMNRRPRRATAAMVVVVVVALVGALAVLGSRHPNNGGHTGGTSSVGDTASSSPGSGQSHAGGTNPGGAKTKKDHHSSTTTTSTTTPTQVVAVASTANTATYPVSATGSYTVTVRASGPCWVLATNASTGSTLWTGTLQAGGSEAIPATGTVTVQLGAPTATLALDNVPVAFPDPAHTPFVATFEPSATGSSGTGTSTSTTAPVPSTTAATSTSTSTSAPG